MPLTLIQEFFKNYRMSDKCWICGNEELVKVKDANIEQVESKDFAITNSNYGVTHAIYQCSNCNFLQCSKNSDVLSFYEELIDPEYESTREARKLQEEKVLDLIQKYKKGGRILDIGAGSGILIEAAIERGFDAIGVEPSKWLTSKATERGLPVKLGIFPSPEITGKFDVITLVDVIEHVDNPTQLVKEIANYLNDDGIFVMVTPDVNSFFAKTLGYKWWHYRVAHIGYFNKTTMNLLSESARLKTLRLLRPSWYFSLSYLIQRVYTYLPKFLRFPLPNFLSKIIIPLNLRDSWMGIYSKQMV